MDRSDPSPPAPQEMQAAVTLRLRDLVHLEASASTSPAGLVAVGLLVSGILLSTAALLLVARPRR